MKVPSNRLKDVYRYYYDLLKNKYDPAEAGQLLYILFDEYAGVRKAKIYTDPDSTINESELLRIHFAVKDLLKSVPVQQIIGYTEFYNCRIEVNPQVLIPRPETEQMVDIILKNCKDSREGGLRILDIGTGSGAIAITLKKYLPSAKIFAIDFSKSAIEKAEENAALNGTDIEFIHLDILDPVAEKKLQDTLDIIVSNPPYVMEKEKKHMKNNVLEHEPASALFVPDYQPLLFYERIALLGLQLLKKNAIIYVEINESLGAETVEVFTKRKYQTTLLKDLNEKDRFIRAIKI